MIRVHALNKFYGTQQVLKNVSFTVEEHEILGFLGPNGAGKTTTLQILTGYAPANSGIVSINGYDVVRQAQKAREQIGYLPEAVPLYLDQTPKSYLRFRAKLKGIPYGQRSLFLEEVIEKCELGDVLEKKIGMLSKGYRQRVGLADALLAKPPILILDEPTEGLDPLQKRALGKLIQELKQHHTIIFSTHILSEVAAICSKVFILHQGRKLALDTPARLLQQLHQGRRKYEAVILGTESKILKALEGIEGIEEATWVGGGEHRYHIFSHSEADPRGLIFQVCAKHGFTLLELVPAQEGLEEIFVQLVQSQEGVA